jgi:hypothetical protein
MDRYPPFEFILINCEFSLAMTACPTMISKNAPHFLKESFGFSRCKIWQFPASLYLVLARIFQSRPAIRAVSFLPDKAPSRQIP